ncbi:hypothetical protein H2201_002757 [Coniosporium apollinis]|uniref:Histone deacetylase complex subunit SAP18 n=1 Tax=Coniosporium apollinis TaxID=61459 RepID=A0ABQ9P1Q3_9PEZI|nr:hypothetical protein H2201_002757 [Coniosporium apollinis]
MAPQPPAQKIDRQTTTPFLLKLYYRTGTFHRLEEFSPSSASPPPPHLQIYTWPSCTLRELTHLLLTALPSLLPSPAIGTRLSYRLVYPDTRDYTARGGGPPGAGRYLSKELGSVVVGAGGPGVESAESVERDRGGEGEGTEKRRGLSQAELERLEGDAEKTLQDARFVIGDYISCAVFPPLPNGDVATGPAPGAAFRGSRDLGPPPRGPPPRDVNGFGGNGGYGGRGRAMGGGVGRFEGGPGRGGGYVPPGEWRRGERLPDVGYGGGFGRGRGRGRGW